MIITKLQDIIITKRNQVKLNLKAGRTGNLDAQGFVIRMTPTREASKKIMPFGQNLITSAALKAAPTYGNYYSTDYYGTEYSDYNEVEVEEYYYEGIISTCYFNIYFDMVFL